MVSSTLGSIGNTDASWAASYRISKAALNMACKTLANEPTVREAGAKVLALHPGWVDTDMGSSGGRKPPLNVEESTAGILEVIERALRVQREELSECDALADRLVHDNCAFVQYDGELLPW